MNQLVLVFCLFVFVQKQDEYTNSGFIRQLTALGKTNPVQLTQVNKLVGLFGSMLKNFQCFKQMIAFEKLL